MATIKKQIIIESDGTSFSAYYRAEKLLKAEGFTIGSMCRDEPIGFADSKKYNYIAKWDNIPTHERKFLDGVIESKDFRDGSVTISYWEK